MRIKKNGGLRREGLVSDLCERWEGDNMVRLAEEKDLACVNEIREQVNDIHVNGRPDIFRPGFCKEMQELVYQMWKSENSDILVVERNGEICGMSCVEYVLKPESPYNLERKYYHIIEFAVHEKFRRQGVATELFNYIKKDAMERGYDRIELDMWEFNESARKFYESVGFYTYRRYMEYDI